MLTRHRKMRTGGMCIHRIRKKIQGTAERPRLNVYRSLNHIYVQLIDDLKGRDCGIGQFRGRQKERKRATGGNVASAKAVGKAIAERAKEKGISRSCLTVADISITDG